MARFKVHGNKRDIFAVVVKNAEATITIKRGAPLVLAANGTDDGMGVLSCVNLAAALQATYFGQATSDIAPGAFGDAQVFGFMDQARILITTRAASTDVWASYGAGSIGEVLSMATGTGTAGSSSLADQALARCGTAAFTAADKQIMLAETFASATTQASSLNASNTASTAYKKIILRAM